MQVINFTPWTLDDGRMARMARMLLDHHPATYEDLVAVPENLVAEILDGDLYTSPRPAPRHALAYARLMATLMPPFDLGRGGPGGWVLLAEPELHLGRDVLVPDLAGWRRERMPRLPDTAFFPLAPDWVCEVLSPSTVAIDRAEKLRIYAREGVGHAWLVDPIARTLEVLVRRGEQWTLTDIHHGASVVRVEPFADVPVELQVLWSEVVPAGLA